MASSAKDRESLLYERRDLMKPELLSRFLVYLHFGRDKIYYQVSRGNARGFLKSIHGFQVVEAHQLGTLLIREKALRNMLWLPLN